MKRLIIYLILFSFVPRLWAQADNATPKVDSIHLPNVKVFVCKITGVMPYVPKSLNLAEQFNAETAIFFKSYGSGNLSTIAYRGTAASHTAVLWNGVPINSLLNGQTDFSTLHLANADIFSIGSGEAIGGVVRLDETIEFGTPAIAVQALTSMASYQSYEGLLRVKYNTKKIYTSFNYSKEQAVNNYPYYNTTIINDNADFDTQNLGGTLAYKFSKNHEFSLQLLATKTQRNTARTLSSSNNAYLELENTLGLAKWKFEHNKYSHQFLYSLRRENSNYQFDKRFDNYSKHKANQQIISYQPKFELDKKRSVAMEFTTDFTKANGDNIVAHQTNLTQIKAKYQQKFNTKNTVKIKLAQGFSSVYAVPFTFDVYYTNIMSDKMTVSLRAKKNYRLPTFNDLYWNPGGNPNLKPEYSTSYETSINYKGNNTFFKATLFYIQSKDLIKWRPQSGMLWSPVNINRAANYGFEFSISKSINKLYLKANYNYIKATNLDLDKQITYVPKHQVRFLTRFTLDKFNIAMNNSYTSSVFITTSNTQKLKGYLLTDFNFNYKIHKDITLSLAVNNAFDMHYMAYADRPMPGRNFKIKLIYNSIFKPLNKKKNETNN